MQAMVILPAFTGPLAADLVADTATLEQRVPIEGGLAASPGPELRPCHHDDLRVAPFLRVGGGYARGTGGR
jgi:hypothetical protein